jgi:ribonuclease BN (tRNA processing enzyme)
VRLTVVGCAGTFPGPYSPCSAYLVEDDGFRLLLDMGNGAIGNLGRLGDLLNLDAVLVTHLHGDHCLDLVTYTYARRYDPRGAAPPLPVYGPEGLFPRIFNSFDKPRPDMVDDVYAFADIDGSPVEIGPFAITMARTNHPVECYAVRLTSKGRSLTYSADTGHCDDLIKLAHGTDVFLCEASYDDGATNPPDVHLTGREAGEHAKQAEVGRLITTHHVPWNNLERVFAAASDAFPGPSAAAAACAVYDV